MTSLKPKQVGVLVGSLRRGSFSRKFAKALIARRFEVLQSGSSGGFRAENGGAWKLVHRHADMAEAKNDATCCIRT